MVLGQKVQRILLRQVLLNVWIFIAVTMVLHVSVPYSRTGSTVVLRILILMVMVRSDDAQMFSISRKAAFNLPIRSLT